MANLYQLTTEYAALMAEYDMAEDEQQREEVWQMIDALQDDIGDKAEAYARIIRNLQADAEAYKAESQRLARKQKAAEAAVDGLKRRLLDAMKYTGATEITTSIGKWRVQMNPWSVDVLDADEIPMEYHIPQPDKIDKAALLRHFKETGEMLDGAMFSQTRGLRFR